MRTAAIVVVTLIAMLVLCMPVGMACAVIAVQHSADSFAVWTVAFTPLTAALLPRRWIGRIIGVVAARIEPLSLD